MARIGTILVVGGGVAGLTAATALHRQGFTTELVERQQTWHAVGAGFLVHVSQDTSAYGVDLKYAESPWKDRQVRANFSTWLENSANSALGSGCNTSIRIRTSTRSSV